jgi:hypothetical protein
MRNAERREEKGPAASGGSSGLGLWGRIFLKSNLPSSEAPGLALVLTVLSGSLPVSDSAAMAWATSRIASAALALRLAPRKVWPSLAALAALASKDGKAELALDRGFEVGAADLAHALLHLVGHHVHVRVGALALSQASRRIASRAPARVSSVVSTTAFTSASSAGS